MITLATALMLYCKIVVVDRQSVQNPTEMLRVTDVICMEYDEFVKTYGKNSLPEINTYAENWDINETQ